MAPGLWRVVDGSRVAHCCRETTAGAMQSLCGAVHILPTLLTDRTREPHCKRCERIAHRAPLIIETLEQ